MSWYNQLVARSGDAAGRPLKKLSRYRSIFTCCFAEIASFSWLVQFVHAYGEQASQGILWAPFTRFAFDSYKKIITGLSLDWFEMRVGPHLPTPSQMGIPAIPGKLGSACTGAGKRRLFAIGNYVNQRLLAPVHEWLACVLRSLKTDGTFNPVKQAGGVPWGCILNRFKIGHGPL